MKRKFGLSLNHVKIVFAIAVLIFDIAGVVSAWVGVFYPGIVMFCVLGIVTLDYIRVIRRELKLGPWYKLDNIDE